MCACARALATCARADQGREKPSCLADVYEEASKMFVQT